MKGDEREFTFFEHFCLPSLAPYINYSTYPSGNPLSRQELTIFTYQETSSTVQSCRRNSVSKGQVPGSSLHFQIFCLELPCHLLSPGWLLLILGGYEAHLHQVIC